MNMNSEEMYNLLRFLFQERYLEMKEYEQEENYFNFADSEQISKFERTKNVKMIYIDAQGVDYIQNNTIIEAKKIIFTAMTILNGHSFDECDPNDPLFLFLYKNNFNDFILKFYENGELIFDVNPKFT